MTVHYWETGHVSQPRHQGRFHYAQRLAAVLQTPVDVLMSPENENGPATNGDEAAVTKTTKAIHGENRCV